MNPRTILRQLQRQQQPRSSATIFRPTSFASAQPHLSHSSRRSFSASLFRRSEAPNVVAPEYLDAAERKIFDTLKETFKPSKLEVQDVSGGCGSMYALDIVSEQFKGLTTIKQHRLVNQALGEEIKKWHGVQMKTKAPE
jgi:stress-induced morphogen